MLVTRPWPAERAVLSSQAKFREITEAYEILSDPEKRVLYDHTGIAAARKGLEHQQEQGGSPFDMFFGGGGRQESKRGQG